MSTTTVAPVKPKFVSVLVTESAKAYIVELREKSKMTEKDLLDVLVALAKTNESDIIAAGLAADEAYQAEKKAKALVRYEDFKAEQKQVRAAARVAKADKKVEVAAEPAVEAA